MQTPAGALRVVCATAGPSTACNGVSDDRGGQYFFPRSFSIGFILTSICVPRRLRPFTPFPFSRGWPDPPWGPDEPQCGCACGAGPSAPPTPDGKAADAWRAWQQTCSASRGCRWSLQTRRKQTGTPRSWTDLESSNSQHTGVSAPLSLSPLPLSLSLSTFSLSLCHPLSLPLTSYVCCANSGY